MADQFADTIRRVAATTESIMAAPVTSVILIPGAFEDPSIGAARRLIAQPAPTGNHPLACAGPYLDCSEIGHAATPGHTALTVIAPPLGEHLVTFEISIPSHWILFTVAGDIRKRVGFM